MYDKVWWTPNEYLSGFVPVLKFSIGSKHGDFLNAFKRKTFKRNHRY